MSEQQRIVPAARYTAPAGVLIAVAGIGIGIGIGIFSEDEEN